MPTASVGVLPPGGDHRPTNSRGAWVGIGPVTKQEAGPSVAERSQRGCPELLRQALPRATCPRQGGVSAQPKRAGTRPPLEAAETSPKNRTREPPKQVSQSKTQPRRAA